MSGIAEILNRLRAATGPDREIDVAIWRLFDRPDAPLDRVPLPWLACYTSRIDHALKLAPGAYWRVGHDGEGPDPSMFKAEVMLPPDMRFGVAVHEHAAIALCIAMLAARQEPTP